ncbi:MAG: HAD-IA family hydrolase [Cyanobacteria bacterium P01_H01_bin.153]
MSTLIFDFDGTIADSLSAIVAITNRLAPEFGFRPTPLAEVDALKGLTARQLIRYSGIPILKIPALLRRVRTELRGQSAQIPPCQGMPDVIRELHAQQHQLAVITSNTPEAVRAFLTAHQLDYCFIGIDGGGTLFRKGKLIARCLEQHQIDAATTVYVGDEVRDIDAARFAGIRSVSVTWGFNTKAALITAQPNWVVDRPERLLAIANALSPPH